MKINEICWAMVYYGTPIAEILMEGYCFYRFSKPFLENKRGAFGIGAVYFLTMMLFYLMPISFDNFISCGTGIFAAFLVMCGIDRNNYVQKTFLAVTFFALRGFAFAVAEILYDRLYSFAEGTRYMAAHPETDFILYAGVCLFYLLLEFTVMAVGIRCILKNYACKQEAMSKKELLVLVVPSLMGTAGYEVIWCYRKFYLEKIRETSVMYDCLSLLYYAAALATIVMVITLYQKIKEGQEQKVQNKLLAMQVDSIRQHIGQVESLYQNIRGMKHDMTNHIITLERLYAANKAEEAKNYGKELRAVLSETENGINSGNPVTDVILQEMQRNALEKGIRFDVDFHYPIGSGVNAFDISVILNNALHNALEYAANEESPYISILSYCRKNACMIEISNSFTGNLQWNAQSGLPMTSKKKEDGHGYGLTNIRRTAQKYAGDISVDLENGRFCLSILLMCENTCN